MSKGSRGVALSSTKAFSLEVLSATLHIDCALNRLCGLAGVLAEVLFTDLRNVPIGANQDALSFGRGNLGCTGSAHVFKEPAPVVEPDIRHAVSGLQTSRRIARGQRARPIVQGELIGRVTALD